MLVYRTHLGKHKTLNVGTHAAKHNVFSFVLAYRMHLGKHNTQMLARRRREKFAL